MTDLSKLRNWFFKSLAVEDKIDELEIEGIAVRESSNPGAVQRVLHIEDFPLEVRKSAIKALPAYIAIHCFENSIRSFVTDRLAETYGSDWWNTQIPKAIKDKVASRRNKEGSNRWHVSRGASPIYYTDFGDLNLIIQNNWSEFEDVFPDVPWISSRLSDLETSRNIIAHSNVLDDREIDRIKLYIQDWIKQLG